MKETSDHEPRTALAPQAGVLLVNPKFPHNVAGAMRACAVFGAGRLAWTPERVPAPDQWPPGARLPREERLRAYRHVRLTSPPRSASIDEFSALGYTPVAVELRDRAESLIQFVHPARALYVFGPEDGSLARGELTACHRFVQIPASGCLNLAAAVNVVLYDRRLKLDVSPITSNGREGKETH
jgi:tRNA C32,U32 (ribose-2'-O)-methylase TrmJ